MDFHSEKKLSCFFVGHREAWFVLGSLPLWYPIKRSAIFLFLKPHLKLKNKLWIIFLSTVFLQFRAMELAGIWKRVCFFLRSARFFFLLFWVIEKESLRFYSEYWDWISMRPNWKRHFDYCYISSHMFHNEWIGRKTIDTCFDFGTLLWYVARTKHICEL